MSHPPKRIQRQRTKGWRMPANTVYVGRPSKWGNPYRVGDADLILRDRKLTPKSCVRMFEWYLEGKKLLNQKVAKDLKDLRGKDLACWCSLDQPCHADVLLRIANEKENKT